MAEKNWNILDERFWTLILGVVEGLIVIKLTEFEGTCNFLNITLMPCWVWGLIVWTISMIVTYYFGIKGAYWLFVGRKLNSQLKTIPMNNINAPSAHELPFSLSSVLE